MRKKTFTYDGFDITISPLSMAQVSTWASEEGKNLKRSEVLCMALNNALRTRGTNGEWIDPVAPQLWTPERIREEFDSTLMDMIWGDFMQYSGIQTEPVKEEVKSEPGEKLAASAK